MLSVTNTGTIRINGTFTVKELANIVSENAGQYFTDMSQPHITSSNDSIEYLKTVYSGEQSEVFGVLFLTTRHQVISFKKMFFGTIDGSSVHCREIVKECLNQNAAAVIICHNHPSGDTTPSGADIKITGRIKESLQLIDVRLLDHLIISDDIHCSMADKGMV